MTLVEVVIALSISGLVILGIVNGYYFCTRSAEKGALLLAANAKAMERIEEARSAKWDTSSYPPVDQLMATNFPREVVVLDKTGTGEDITLATIETQISQISSSPPVKRIHVDCIWEFDADEMITNSIETYRSPDQ